MQLSYHSAFLHIPHPVDPMQSEVRKIDAHLAGLPLESHVYIGDKQFKVSQVWLTLDDDDGQDGIHVQLAPI